MRPGQLGERGRQTGERIAAEIESAEFIQLANGFGQASKAVVSQVQFAQAGELRQ